MLLTTLLLAMAVHATPDCKESKPGLKAQAKITCEHAHRTAMTKVNKAAQVKSSELEMENGKLVYSFDIKEPGKDGIEEVQIDAQTGEVVSVKHESARQEAEEAAKEKAEHDKEAHEKH